MDFQKLADSYQAMACVFSVQKTEDGGCGEIRVVAGNKKYIDIVEHPIYALGPGMKMHDLPKFVPGSLYQTYVPRNLEFEEICRRAAVQKEPLHTYLKQDGLDLWFHIFAIPLDCEEDDLCYCLYITKQTGMTSVQSAKISEDVLKTCLKLDGADDFRTTMDEVIRDIRVLCGAEICTILLMDYAARTCSVLAANLRENSKLKRVTEFEDYFSVADTWRGLMGEDDCIIISSEADMKYYRDADPIWWATLKEAGVDSVVLFPLNFNQEILGYIWATNFDTRHTERIKETLGLTTFFLSSRIANYKMLRRLEHIGFTDMLTGVQNRNAMNNRVTDILSAEAYRNVPFGVVFADLNGLKTVNDTQGHSAGDLLLKKAALLLQELFADEDIYRAGGDEFVVVVSGCTRRAFVERVQALKDRSDSPENVCFAVGSWYAESGREIRNAMCLADQNMYKDKEDFYRRHPENDRRKRNRTT